MKNLKRWKIISWYVIKTKGFGNYDKKSFIVYSSNSFIELIQTAAIESLITLWLKYSVLLSVRCLSFLASNRLSWFYSQIKTYHTLYLLSSWKFSVLYIKMFSSAKISLPHFKVFSSSKLSLQQFKPLLGSKISLQHIKTFERGLSWLNPGCSSSHISETRQWNPF